MSPLSLPSLCFLLLCLWGGPSVAKEVIPVGLVLDLNSTIGTTARSYISMALLHFYETNAHYKTRIQLRTRDSKNDVVAAAFAALDLLKNEKVHAIIGPQSSGQAKFVIELGRKAQVPIISFSATSPSLSTMQNQFFIRTAQDDCSQAKAIAAIVEYYGWREIILIYEDTEYGNGLIPYLMDAFEQKDTRVPQRIVIDPDSQEQEILKRLKNLINNETLTRIFLVHMTPEHGSKLFSAAKKAEMMTEGFAWIVTEGLSALLNPMDSNLVMESMQGVIGVKPAVNKSTFDGLKRKMKATGKANCELTLFGLWAYDTAQALAIAVEKSGLTNSSFMGQNITSNGSVDLSDTGWHKTGPMLVKNILASTFKGVSGDFNLSKGQLEPSTLEIFNVVGHTERTIGYWRKASGLFKGDKSKGNDKLQQPIWPGGTTQQPTKLRIGVPVKIGFNEFMKVEKRQSSNDTEYSGFAVDVFQEVRNVLPFPLPYEFHPFQNENGEPAGTYDDLLHQIKMKKFDAVVGDITIVAERSNYVDFTLPYSESGVSMVVPMKHDHRKNMWIFLKPLSLGLWLATGGAFFFTGFIIWLLEHRTNTEFRGPPDQQLGTMFWFSFSTLVFAHKERIVNNWSRLVLIIWVFVVLIITQSYTASLTSMLTVQNLQPAFIDVNEIKRNDYYVGYQNESFVRDLLTGQLGFNPAKLRRYDTPEEIHIALSAGSNNNGVAAIFDEIPYLKVFLAKYGSRYKMVGPTYKTAGFGFAFPRKSPLVSYFSRAILQVTENNNTFQRIYNNYLSSGLISEDRSGPFSSESPSLTLDSFLGLFIITLVTSLLSLFFYVCNFVYSKWPAALRAIPSDQRSVWALITEMAKQFDRKDGSLHPPTRSNSRIVPATADEGFPASDDTDNQNEEAADNNVTVNEEDNGMHSPDQHSGHASSDVSQSS